ncbi:MAG: PKD domain-containing protein [bacterium]
MKIMRFVLSWLIILTLAGCFGGGSGPSNNPPSVSLSALPSSGAAPLAVQFTANASDSDGSVIKYEWDFDYNGAYDSVTTTNTISHTYSSSGAYKPHVRVTDDAGALAEASTDVNVDVYIPEIAFTAVGTPVANSVYIEQVSTNDDEITLAVKIKGGSNVWAASVVLNLDANIKYISKTDGDYLGTSPVQLSDDNGVLIIGCSLQLPVTTGVDGDGTLVTIKLKALATQSNTTIGFNTTESSLLIYTAGQDDPSRFIQGTTWLGGNLSYQ